MTGIKEFIIEVGRAFNNTLQYGSLELYTDHRARQQEQSNRIGKVISKPLTINSEIEVGAEVLIDPTVLFEQVYENKVQESRFIVDRDKGWYRVTPDMIILYRNRNEETFLGNKQNLLVEPINDEITKVGSIYLAKPEEQQEHTAIVAVANKELIAQGINTGDTIYYNKKAKWEYEFQGKKYLYLQNFYVFGKQLSA
jgi:co-chaperonin GroES (HSP10)